MLTTTTNTLKKLVASGQNHCEANIVLCLLLQQYYYCSYAYYTIIQNSFFTILRILSRTNLCFSREHFVQHLEVICLFQPPASLILSLCAWSNNFSFWKFWTGAQDHCTPCLEHSIVLIADGAMVVIAKTVLNCGVHEKN